MIITDILEQNMKAYAEETALIEINPEVNGRKGIPWSEYELVEPNRSESFRREITWKEFDEKSNRFANLLIKKGYKKGDKIAILLMNCIEWLPIYFGILKTGAIAVPLNFRYTSEEIKYCIELSETNGLVFGSEFIDRIEAIKNKINCVSNLFFVGTNNQNLACNYDYETSLCSPVFTVSDISPEDNAAIYFSSGTTGFPKAILHTHKSLLSSCFTENKHHYQTHQDNFLCIPPLYHTGAKMHWFGSFLVGGKAVLLKGVKPEWIIKAVSEEKCTIVWLLVPWAQDILDAIERGDIDLNNYELSQWRLMHIGAQPVPPSLIHRWQKHFPNHQYDTNYGLSESIGPGCVHLGIENTHKVGAIGIPGYGWEVKIVDEKEVPVNEEAVGELCVKGPGVMKCYYRDEIATKSILKNGWLFTGDMAKMDKDGFIFLVDRKKDVIISGGENIYPVQIEDFLRSYNAIKDVAVIGLPDKRLGEIAAAIIELKPNFTSSPEEIEEFCHSLPRYKRPKQIIFDKVPRNATGKIEKPKLRAKYCCDSIVTTQTQG